jgi:hypothetical protein
VHSRNGQEDTLQKNALKKPTNKRPGAQPRLSATPRCFGWLPKLPRGVNAFENRMLLTVFEMKVQDGVDSNWSEIGSREGQRRNQQRG